MVVQLLGFGVAYVTAVIAYFALPPAWFSPNALGTRLVGVVAAVMCAIALPAGLWEMFRRTQWRIVAALAAVIGLVVLVGWTAWGLQLGWSVSL